jgi:leucyl/phenylalanyl-tRNA---protein transferase
VNPVMLDNRLEFPDPLQDFSNPPGLVAIGGDLSVERLLLAYRSGLFPWTAQPATWWCPDPRAIFEFDRFHVPRSVRKIVKRCVVVESPPLACDPGNSPPFHVTINCAFTKVMQGCATARADNNWISPSFITAYTRLHEAGYAHSVECWQNGELVGGIYGVAVGGLFAGESMFHRVDNASKVALYFLTEFLRHRGFTLFDIQTLTPTTEQFGATLISRAEYLERLKTALQLPVTFR